jgi:hypothetical protein
VGDREGLPPGPPGSLRLTLLHDFEAETQGLAVVCVTLTWFGNRSGIRTSVAYAPLQSKQYQRDASETTTNPETPEEG